MISGCKAINDDCIINDQCFKVGINFDCMVEFVTMVDLEFDDPPCNLLVINK